MKKYDVHFSLRGTIEIEANSEEEAKDQFFSSDSTDANEIIDAAKKSIGAVGNEAIDLDDVFEKS